MKLTITTDKMMALAWCMLFVYAACLVPADALAFNSGGDTDSGVIGGLLCNVAAWFSNSVGKGIATLAIIVVGIGALMGKVSWGMAIIVGLGVAVIFGAPQLVGELGGTDGC